LTLFFYKKQYIDVPQVDEVHLGAEVRFPNLSVNATTVNFGAVLNDTTERKTITISNRGDVPARYEWVFDVLDNESLNDSVDESAMDLSAEPSSLSVTSVVSKRDARRTRYQRRMGSGNKSNTPLKRLVNPETVFDVRPIRGVLQPGESEVVEVSYFARADSESTALRISQIQALFYL
jgi:hydrocephalus-inducing protein